MDTFGWILELLELIVTATAYRTVYHYRLDAPNAHPSPATSGT